VRLVGREGTVELFSDDPFPDCSIDPVIEYDAYANPLMLSAGDVCSK
jgi:hypothetical protein